MRKSENQGQGVVKEMRSCDEASCEKEGLYRAPRSRERMRDYYWFCLEHVKVYNRNWNYFAGMNEGEVVNELRASERRVDDVATLYHVHGLHGDLKIDVWWGEERGCEGSHFFGEEVRDCLEVLGVEVSEVLSAWKEDGEGVPLVRYVRRCVHGRYKALAKKHHPDLRGEGSAEDFKRINEVYSRLCGLLV